MLSTASAMQFLVVACLSVCCIYVIVNAELAVHIPEHTDCILTLDVGYCWLKKTRYAYDMLRGQCVKFVYTGCGGNKNRFKTKSGCVDKCITGASSKSEESSGNI